MIEKNKIKQKMKEHKWPLKRYQDQNEDLKQKLEVGRRFKSREIKPNQS